MTTTASQRPSTQDAVPNPNRRRLSVDVLLILILLLSLIAAAPLFRPGYFWQAHDARHSVYFVFEFDRGIQDGILYPRWQPDFAFGYGYPFFNIYGPLSTYLAELFHLVGFGIPDAVKIVFGLSILGSGLAMYGFVRQTMGRQAGLVAAVAYMVVPYHLVDLYVRAALAESVAYVFVPLVLWATWHTLHQPRLANLLALAFAYAALIYTHPLTALLLTLVLVFYVAAVALARTNDRQPWRQISRESLLPLLGHLGHVVLPTMVGLLWGIGLSALFAIPAVTENRFVRADQWYGGRYAWGGDFVDFFQLFSPQWGFGSSVPGPGDSMSFQLGVVPVVLSLFGLAVVLRGGKSRPLSGLPPTTGGRTGHPRRLVAFFAVLAAVVVFLMLDVSSPLWAALPLARLTQFPWRLLGLAVLSLAVMCGAVLWQERPTSGWLAGPTVAIVVLLVLGSFPYMQADMSDGQVTLAELMRFQQSSDEMTGSTAWVRRIPRWSSMADYFVADQPFTSKVNYGYLYRQAGTVHARTLELRAQSELVEYYANRPALITFDTFYYPGWRAYLVDPETGQVQQELTIALRGELGLMTVRVPPGIKHVLLRFENTPVRKLGIALTIASLGLVGLVWLGRFLLRAKRQVTGTSPQFPPLRQGEG